MRDGGYKITDTQRDNAIVCYIASTNSWVILRLDYNNNEQEVGPFRTGGTWFVNFVMPYQLQ